MNTANNSINKRSNISRSTDKVTNLGETAMDTNLNFSDRWQQDKPGSKQQGFLLESNILGIVPSSGSLDGGAPIDSGRIPKHRGWGASSR